MKDKDSGKRKRLRLFDYNRNGKGISKSKADLGFGLKRFFISFKDNFNKILYVNIFMVLGNFPLIFTIAAWSGFTQTNTYAPMNDLVQNFAPVFAGGEMSPADMLLYGLEGLQAQTMVPSVWTYVLYGFGALILFTFGLVNVGSAYILRNIAKGEPVFVWNDFWYAVKKNWKQALPFGIIDVLIHTILLMNIFNMFAGTAQFLTSVMFWSNVIIFILYFFMRYYIYVQMVTFKLSVFKIFKNSLIFALLGFKRNIMALLGILLIVLIEFLCIFGVGGILVPIAVALPLAIAFSFMAYMKVYASYYKIKQVMIDPYLEEHPEEKEIVVPSSPYEDEGEDEVIMRDDVSEQERLDEIKKRNGIN